MSHYKVISALLCFHLLIAPAVFSQYKFDKPVQITKENGLPANNITGIRKSDDGFMWIGTGEGLCRFDGQHIKVYRMGTNLKYSLFDNVVTCVLPDKNFIWIGTNQGISVLNTMDQTFRHYQFDERGKSDSLTRRFGQAIHTLYKDRAGKIWIGTRNKGLYMYDDNVDNFRTFSIDRDKYPWLSPLLGGDNAILSIVASKTNDSIIWAGTAGGLLEINKYGSEAKLFTYPKESKDYQVALNAFRRIYHHTDGLLYVGSWGASVNVFNPVTRTFTPLEVRNAEERKILNSTIGGLCRKSDHEIWISCGSGLCVYDTDKKEIIWRKYNVATEKEIYAIDYMDEVGRVWHGDINGVQYFDPTMQQFSSYTFKHLSGPDFAYAFYILPDKNGEVIVCPRVTDGFYRFDPKKGEWRKTPFPNNTAFKNEKNVIRGFVRLPSGDFVLSSYQGIFLYSEKKNQLTDITKRLPFSSIRWGEIILDRFENLWLSPDAQGLMKWNLKTNEYTLYTQQLLNADPGKPFGRIVNFFADSRGNVWFERANGFGVYVAAADSIVNFIFSKNEKNAFPIANSFAEDRKGRVWVSSDDGWLGYAELDDPFKGIVYKINAKQKGFTGYFTELATDHNGDVWAYTAKDLVKISADDFHFTRYSFRYGIEEPDFYSFSFLPSGEIIFGGRNDVVIANPGELKRNTEMPVPYIDELEVLNEPFKFNMNGSPANLSYKQNFFSIHFSAKAYTMAKDVRFRYRLKNFDNWTEATGSSFANYTNVPGGDYVFQLQAANNEGIWNDKIVELPIFIATSFWKTWWFRIGVVLIVAALAYWFYRYRLNQVKKKQKMKSEYEKKLANVEMSALLAQMNPHFLFNSLNSIDSYIIRNESKKASEYLNNFARLMRLILQNSRSNYISMKDELEALDLYLQMEKLRFMGKFEYEIKIEDGIDTASIVIPPMLIQPYVENAIWHGLMHKKDGTPGKVEIIISRDESDLICVVKDNGIGREKAEELKAQKSGNHKRSMGMQITSDRIEMINKLYNTNTSVKIIDMRDDSGKATGTFVKLAIPV